MQWLPSLLGAGLVQDLLLDIWPPEQELQEDQQLHPPLINPNREKCDGFYNMQDKID